VEQLEVLVEQNKYSYTKAFETFVPQLKLVEQLMEQGQDYGIRGL
jgi:hypothetical protein